MKPNPKPVRECRGCILNLTDHCAIFPVPAEKWAHRHCEGFNNPEFFERYQRSLHAEGAHARKQARAVTAHRSHTVDHRNGVHPLVTR